MAAAFKHEFGTRLLKQLDKLKEMVPEGKADMIGKFTPPVTAVARASDHKKKADDQAALLPKSIDYDAAGRPTNEQDTALKVNKTGTTEIIDWATWAQTTAVTQHYEKLDSKLACASALLRIHVGTPTAVVPIKMVKEKGKTKCVALEDLEIGRLKLPLTIWKEESLQDESKHPRRVRVTYKVQRNASSTTASECVRQASFAVAPELSLPKWTPEVSGEGMYHDWEAA